MKTAALLFSTVLLVAAFAVLGIKTSSTSSEEISLNWPLMARLLVLMGSLAIGILAGVLGHEIGKWRSSRVQDSGRGRKFDAVARALVAPASAASVAASASAIDPISSLLFALVLSFVVVGIGAALLTHRIRAHRPWRATAAGVIACTALLVSVGETAWPLRAAFGISRSHMEALAARVEHGDPVTGPVRAGIFRVLRVERHGNGLVCLWTDLAPGGFTGFVRCTRKELRFNLQSSLTLADRWQFIRED